MREYLFGLGVTALLLVVAHVVINIIFPCVKKYIAPKTSKLVFNCDSQLSNNDGDGEDKNSEEQFSDVLKYLDLSAGSEVVVFEED